MEKRGRVYRLYLTKHTCNKYSNTYVAYYRKNFTRVVLYYVVTKLANIYTI